MSKVQEGACRAGAQEEAVPPLSAASAVSTGARKGQGVVVGESVGN